MSNPKGSKKSQTRTHMFTSETDSFLKSNINVNNWKKAERMC